VRARRKWVASLYACLMVVAGSVVAGVSMDVFLIPNHIAAGGMSGLATVLHHFTHAPIGLTMLVLEVPLFAASVKVFGPVFGFRSLLGTVSIAASIDLLSGHVPTISDPLLSVFYGGALAGLGLGLAFRSGGTTGGTDVVARLVHHYAHISVGQSLLIVDGCVIAFAGVVFGAVPALYAIIVLLITGRVVDFVQEGPNYAKGAFVISDNPDAIRLGILKDMNRGVTILHGQGGFTGTAKEVLFVVVGRREIAEIKQLVRLTDPRAFVVITDVREVFGEGFMED
jgi:uncharacterized membrane-anchored protein YitT (DUF2179 family)